MAEVAPREKHHKKKRREKEDEDGSKKKKKKKSTKKHRAEQDEEHLVVMGEQVATTSKYFPPLPPPQEKTSDDDLSTLKRPPSISPPHSPHPVYVASGTPLQHQQQQQATRGDEELVEVEKVIPPPPSVPPTRTATELLIEEITEKMDRMRDRYRHGTLHLVSVFQFVRADVGTQIFASFVVPTMHVFHDTLVEYFTNPEVRHPAEAMRMAQKVGEQRSLGPHELAAYIGSIVVPDDTPGVWSILLNNSKP